MSEWLKEHAWKACVRLRVPRVRISPSPPQNKQRSGGVAERLNALVLKTSKGLCPSEVRILSPPHVFRQCLKTAFKENWHYIGSGEDPEERVKRHNKGKVRSSKGYRPLWLIYTEKYATRSEAFR